MVTLRSLTYLLLFAAAAPGQQPLAELVVDAGRVQGEIRFHTEAVLERNPAQGDDYNAYLEAFGERLPDRVVIPLALGTQPQGHRPDNRWGVFPAGHADPADPASYDFRAVEAILEAVTPRTAAVIRFDTGSSGDSSGDGIAEAARAVAMHLQRGRAHGRAFGIAEWLVCDSEALQRRPMPPEGAGTGSMFRAGTTAGGVVQALRSVEPRLPVGHCAAWPETLPDAIEALPRGEAGRSPDFYAWVFPDALSDAGAPRRTAQQIRRWLGGAGGERIGLRVSFSPPGPSLGPGPSSQQRSAEGQAARLAAALIYLHDSPVSAIALDLWSRAAGSGEQRRQAVLRAADQLAATPDRLVTEGGGSPGYALLAGRSDDRARIQILIANHTQEPPIHERTAAPQTFEGYDLAVENLPWGDADFGVACYRVDGAQNPEPVWEGGGRGGSLRLRRSLPSDSVELVVLAPRNQPVSGRMPRRRDRR
jgi:hypothetical protein